MNAFIQNSLGGNTSVRKQANKCKTVLCDMEEKEYYHNFTIARPMTQIIVRVILKERIGYIYHGQ